MALVGYWQPGPSQYGACWRKNSNKWYIPGVLFYSSPSTIVCFTVVKIPQIKQLFLSYKTFFSLIDIKAAFDGIWRVSMVISAGRAFSSKHFNFHFARKMATTLSIIDRFWPNKNFLEAQFLSSTYFLYILYNSLFVPATRFANDTICWSQTVRHPQHIVMVTKCSAVTEEFGRTEMWFLTKLLAFFTSNNEIHLSTCIEPVFC